MDSISSMVKTLRAETSLDLHVNTDSNWLKQIDLSVTLGENILNVTTLSGGLFACKLNDGDFRELLGKLFDNLKGENIDSFVENLMERNGAKDYTETVEKLKFVVELENLLGL